MYITIDMLYTLQDDELYGGARRTAADAAAAKEKEERAERFKKQIRKNDAEFLDEYMEFGREKADRNVDKMLEIVRQRIDKNMRDDQGLGWIHAEAISKTVTKENVVAWLTRRLQTRQQMTEKEKREEAERKQRVKREEEDKE